MCMTEFCGSSDYCNKCINNPNGDKKKMTKLSMSEEEMLKRKYTRPYEKRIAELEEHNKKLQRACYKWFMRWRREKIEVIRVSNMAGFKCNQELMQKNAELEKEIEELKTQNEKMKCCGNCGNEKCTSKYRGNSAYHRQADGYACADNEDWIMRLK